jgi:hypothetical protein
VNWIDKKPEIRKFVKWEAAWLAGVIDSDGSFGLYDYGKEGRRVLIQVGNTSEKLLWRIREVIGCGSNVNYAPSYSHKGRKPMYMYALKGSARCYWVLRQIVPFLIIKKEHALSIIRELEEKPFGRWANATPEAREMASKQARTAWADPVIRARRIQGMKDFYAKIKQ